MVRRSFLVKGPVLIKRSRKRMSFADRAFDAFVIGVLTLMTLMVLYPLIYVISASFSAPSAVSSGQVVFLPVKPSLEGYTAVFKNSDVWMGYRNTIFYTVAGTLIDISVTLICAYPLARKNLKGRGIFTIYFTFTMLFSGGMIPNYILMRDLRLINTYWALLIPGALSIYNMIVARTFIQTTIPDELLEASQLDGCSDFRFFISIVLPLSQALIAVLAIFYAVGHWNAYFSAFLYLNKREMFPLQLFLREILVQNTVDLNSYEDVELVMKMQGLADVLKFSLIVVSTAPILCIYPFVQKFFIKGVMLGSVKG